MTHPTLETDGRVRGEMVQVCIDGVMSVFQNRMREMLDEEGIEKPDPRPDEWYRLEEFLRVLEAVETNAGESALKKVGESTPRFVDWPASGDSPDDGLAQLGDLYEKEHEGAQGGYTYESDGEDGARITSTTPYPTVWESGLVKGTAQHFGADYAMVDVVDEGSEVAFEVRW